MRPKICAYNHMKKKDLNRLSLMCSLSIQIVQIKTKNAQYFFTIT